MPFRVFMKMRTMNMLTVGLLVAIGIYMCVCVEKEAQMNDRE